MTVLHPVHVEGLYKYIDHFCFEVKIDNELYVRLAQILYWIFSLNVIAIKKIKIIKNNNNNNNNNDNN